jgi:winged helix-turn helix protein
MPERWPRSSSSRSMSRWRQPPWLLKDYLVSWVSFPKSVSLLQRGVKPAEVARRLEVSRTSVFRWEQALAVNGRRALRKAPRTGRPPQLSETEKKRLVDALEAGALAQGYATDLWTLARVGKLIEKISEAVFGVGRVAAAQGAELLVPAAERPR